jgi:hypothetical protein
METFVAESNRIEGILRPPTDDEIVAHNTFVALSSVQVENIERFVSVVQPNAVLRRLPSMNVRVGKHIPPSGGPSIAMELAEILDRANAMHHPWNVHLDYETLHPFMDGNGRSGRVLWLWQMLREPRYTDMARRLGFLHSFYYQTLERSRP